MIDERASSVAIWILSEKISPAHMSPSRALSASTRSSAHISCSLRAVSASIASSGATASSSTRNGALAVMRKLGLQAKGASRKHRRAKAVDMGDPRVNLVDRAFDAEARDKPWVDDIACIGTAEGLPCLTAVIDALHRKVVGWSMSGSMTEKLLADALEQAVGREGPPDGFSLVIHDDQGSRHSSQAFRRYLESHGIAKSMSRPVSL